LWRWLRHAYLYFRIRDCCITGIKDGARNTDSRWIIGLLLSWHNDWHPEETAAQSDMKSQVHRSIVSLVSDGGVRDIFTTSGLIGHENLLAHLSIAPNGLLRLGPSPDRRLELKSRAKI